MSTALAKVRESVFLDHHVREVSTDLGQATFFQGKAREIDYTGARVSPIYSSAKHGIHGYLKLSRWRQHGEVTEQFYGLSGVLLVPEEVVTRLAAKDARLKVQFFNSFKISEGSSSSSEESTLDFKFPAARYYSGLCAMVDYFPAESPNDAATGEQYRGALISLVRRLSRMEQWIEHNLNVESIRWNRPTAIPYDGIGARLGELKLPSLPQGIVRDEKA